MNDIDKMPPKCRDCPYWELAAEPYVCSDCTTPVKKCGGDYILRSDAISAIRAVPPGNWAWARYADNVACVPAADVRPERYARWIDMDDHLMCSGCGAPHNEPDKNYCPNCGAKMDKEGE